MTKPLGLRWANKVELHPHNPVWAQLFGEEAARIRGALGDWILDVQHVGSTSIPGIPAKPILDIAVAVENFEEATRCIAPLEALGYVYRGELGIPRRHYFRQRNANDASTHNLHMNEIHGHDYRAHLAFRDHLRANPDSAREYAALKQQLKERFATDRFAYVYGKSAFVNGVLSRAMPGFLPAVGDALTVRANKADTTNYRWWQTTVESVSENEIVTFTPPGHKVEQPAGGWVSRYTIRAFYWLDKFYNLLEVYEEDGSLVEIYIHIASPVNIRNNEIHYTDFELDVVRMSGRETEVLDEDEFAEATKTFGYSAEFQAHCNAVTREAVELARTWQPRGIAQAKI